MDENIKIIGSPKYDPREYSASDDGWIVYHNRECVEISLNPIAKGKWYDDYEFYTVFDKAKVIKDGFLHCPICSDLIEDHEEVYDFGDLGFICRGK